MEVTSSSDIKKIRICTDILALLLQFDEPVREHALKSLVVLLGHKFPRVRKLVAELLYVQFLSDSHAVGPPVSDSDAGLGLDVPVGGVRKRWFVANSMQMTAALDILAATPWETETIQNVRTQRQRLCDVMGLQMKSRAALQGSEQGEGGAPRQRSKQKSASTRVDELDSYESLVREAGRCALPTGTVALHCISLKILLNALSQ